MTAAHPLPIHISIFDVPRIDRGAIMNRAERISELQPLYTVSEALYRAAFDYEQGLMGAIPIEAHRLVERLIDNPASLMKGYKRPGPLQRWVTDEGAREW